MIQQKRVWRDKVAAHIFRNHPIFIAYLFSNKLCDGKNKSKQMDKDFVGL